MSNAEDNAQPLLREPFDAVRIFQRLLLAIVAGSVFAVGVWAYQGIKHAREEAVASQAQSPLNQLQLAFHNYHSIHGRFPPAYIADANGKPMHSWRVLILPYIDGSELYDEYDFSEPWNGPNNSKLASRMSRIYHCPSEPPSDSNTNYVVIVGPDTAFPGAKSTSYTDFKDGLENTILLAEIANSDINWLEPRDLDVATMSFVINDKSKPSISTSRRNGPYIVSAGGITTYTLTDALAPEDLKALTTIAGGEGVKVDDLRRDLRRLMSKNAE